MGGRRRLDAVLAERGLFETRSRAAAAVLAGEVRIGHDGARAAKPGQLVAEDVELSVDAVPRYVSRGGIKLANALAASAIDPAGRRCLDIGASTGGFTHCLLAHGAEHVVALDVAYGELSWRLRVDPRVTVIERFNARSLTPEALPYAPDLVVADVSFISLRLILGPLLASAAATRFDALLLIKPQFEVGRGLVGRGGVVRDPELRRRALLEVAGAALEAGAAFRGFFASGLPGPKGNLETFLALAEPGRGSLPDLEAHAREVEPG
jgi:23S rRNA (cytidine1920-2'-O)/16S rRNA (cytidine1409-2'-O)-methyltransferase